MAYYFFLGYDMLPVPPEKMSIRIRGKNKTISLINEGEANLIKSPGLTDISFTVLLPNNQYSFSDYNSSLKATALGALSSALFGSNFSYKPAKYFLDTFETAKKAATPLRFIVSRMSGSGLSLLFSTNMLVTVEDYSIEEDAKRYGIDCAVPLKLRQYRPFGTKKATLVTDENGNQTLQIEEPRQTLDKTIPNAMTVTAAGSVLEAVKAVSGGSLDWRQIALNNDIYNPAEDVKGRVLKL